VFFSSTFFFRFFSPFRYCTNDSQCKDSNSLERCKLDSSLNANHTDVKYGLCEHKGLFGPFAVSDFVVILLLFVGGAIAAGGGVIFSPLHSFSHFLLPFSYSFFLLNCSFFRSVVEDYLFQFCFLLANLKQRMPFRCRIA
jgi:hypothetical protein